MKLSKNTLEIVENYSNINNMMVFEQGCEIKTVDPASTFFSWAKLDDKFPIEFGIYDLGEFIRILKVYEDPELKFDDISINISSNSSKSKYYFADDITKEMITEQTDDKDNFEIPGTDVQFLLKGFQFKEISKVSIAIASSHIGFIGKNGKLFLSARNFQLNVSNEHDIIIGSTDQEFSMFFSKDNFLNMKGLIDNEVFNVRLLFDRVAEFHNETLNLKYWILPENE